VPGQPDLAALTAIITGATPASAAEAETVWVLAKRGARVVIPATSGEDITQ